MSLPYASTASPDDPIRCSFCGETKERGDFVEDTCRPDFPPTAGICTIFLCESCHNTRHRYAFLDLSHRMHPELLPEEARQ